VQAQMWNIPLRKGKHEGLISLATFERIQERLHGKPKIAVRVDIDEDFIEHDVFKQKHIVL